MRDHGGDIDKAIALFGGKPERWIDLSTGINRRPYPLPTLPDQAWSALPTNAAREALCKAAANAYQTQASVLPVAGAQAAIQLLPRIFKPGRARILSPTYGEHDAALSAAGWEVTNTGQFEDLASADLAVIVNPNNPDGRSYGTKDILGLAEEVACLIVDESFADASSELSLAPHSSRPGLLVLRSFGKFYGLAGIRLGFVLGQAQDLAAIDAMAGPWSVSGPALEIGRVALADASWRNATISRLKSETRRLDAIATGVGWKLVGGTELFRTYQTSNAQAVQTSLARHQIWCRVFAYSKTWVRLGLPGNQAEWSRLKMALHDLGRSRLSWKRE